MRIDPKLVVEFATIAEEASFTRAAQRLHVAQPWLSARLRKLEELLDFRLLDRTTRSVRLTERGVAFYEVARKLAQATSDVDRTARELRRRDRHVLRIGAAPYTKVIRQRRELIDAYVRKHSDVSLEIETGWSHALLHRLDAAEIDLTFLMGPAVRSDHEAMLLRTFGLAFTMSRAHPLASCATLSAQDVSRWPIQVYTRSLYASLWDALYEPLVSVGATLIEVPEMAEGPPQSMVSANDIAAFFDFGADDSGNGEVVRIPLAEPVSVGFYLVRRPGSGSPAADAFWDQALAGVDPGTLRQCDNEMQSFSRPAPLGHIDRTIHDAFPPTS